MYTSPDTLYDTMPEALDLSEEYQQLSEAVDARLRELDAEHELPADHEAVSDAEALADETADTLADNTAEALQYTDKLHEMGVVETKLEEVPVHGPHRLLVLDETVQPSSAFKYNGAAHALLRAAEAGPLSAVHIASAGNAGLAGTIAAVRLGAKSFVYMPKDGSPVKADANRAEGAEVDMSSKDVAGAIGLASGKEDLANGHKHFHPYNDEHGVAGQGLVGIRVVEGILQQVEDGKLDPFNDDVEILIARGGGSLLAGVAVAVMQARQAGLIGTNVRVREVRPERNDDGSLNKTFDGLAVEEPGSLTAPVLRDRRYVEDVVAVSEADAGNAAVRLDDIRGKHYEPSGLAGAAAFERLSAQNHGKPTTYVTVLSGANVTAERYLGLEAQARADTVAAYSSVASGASHQHTHGPVAPISRQQESSAPETEAQQAYREQLEAMGIFLSR